MRKFFILVAFALSFVAIAPFGQASAQDLQDQRRAVCLALAPVQTELRDELAAARVLMQAAPAGPQRAARVQEVQQVRGRLRMLQSIRLAARTSYSIQQLRFIATRYNLAVSLS